MNPVSSAIARLGQGVSHACTCLREAGTQFATSAAHHVERALASCRRTAPPQPAAHEVAPPLRERQVDWVPPPLAGDTPDAQRLQRLHRYLQDAHVATDNDPDQAGRHVLAGISQFLAEEGLGLDNLGAGPHGPRVPGQMDDAPAANDDGRFERRPRSDL